MQISPFRIALCLFPAFIPALYADESPIAPGTSLQPVAGTFELADGPSWDGYALTVPDPFTEKASRYVPAKGEWLPGLSDRRLSGSFYNHGVTWMIDNGRAEILRLDSPKEATVIHREDLEADKTRKPNDLVVDRSGGIYFTLTRAGQVIYVPAGGEGIVVAEGAISANGLILSPDESILYVSEAGPKNILAYDVKSDGSLGDRRLFAKMEDGDPAAKSADGMTIDRAGNVYCAGPAHIWIWAPDGKLLDKIACPERPVNCTFGGSDLRDLYIGAFGGLYVQRMRISGVSPQPPAAWPEAKAAVMPSVTLPEGVTPHLDLTYAQYGTRKMLADIYVPSGEGPHPAAIILHGGGWHSGDKMKFRAMGLELASRGYVTMAVAYRLSGEAKFPANIYDCHAAVRFLRANASEYKADPDRIGVVGGSAGAHLAGLLATTADISELHGDGGNPGVSSAVQAAVVMSGPMEIATGNVAESSLNKAAKKQNAVWLFGGSIKELPEVYALADAHQHLDENTPPILFQYGGTEDPTKINPSLEKMKKLGIPAKVLSHYEGGKHGCWNRHPWFMPMVDDIDAWFQEHL
ncbi:MAG: SMP-30/gluconolactonase/LRE family protein [Verrucomicrobiales bacterium]|nr:SMP-30/gluconolactonase/LRE family protein [Verrucomicrobiales bacterium]